MVGLSLIGLLKKRIKQIREDNGGATAIEIVIGVLIFLLVFCAILDLLVLSWRFAIVSQTTTHVARTVGLQGGIMASAPDGFPGGSEQYVTSSQLKANIEKNFAAASILPGEYSVTVNGVEVGGSVDIDYREFADIRTEVDYTWEALSNFFPGDLSSQVYSKRVAMSEFKYRYDSWVGE